MLARDRGEVNIAFQMPLYPMIDERDTDSSRDNHNLVWNTRLRESHSTVRPCLSWRISAQLVWRLD